MCIRDSYQSKWQEAHDVLKTVIDEGEYKLLDNFGDVWDCLLYTSKDGIASISLQCADLHLNKTIDLIEIYGAPQESYDLSYYFDINRNEIGERFTVKVTVTDVGAVSYTHLANMS